MVMVAMVMAAGVTRIMAGVIHPMAGVIPTTDMDPTGQVIIVDTMMGIIMAVAAETIIPHLITLILKEDADTGMATANPGQVIQDMVPGT
jgi:hypothetical protein